MAKNRVVVTLECTKCAMRNYTYRVSKKRSFEKLSLQKYCSKCHKHQVHKETK